MVHIRLRHCSIIQFPDTEDKFVDRNHIHDIQIAVKVYITALRVNGLECDLIGSTPFL